MYEIIHHRKIISVAIEIMNSLVHIPTEKPGDDVMIPMQENQWLLA